MTLATGNSRPGTARSGFTLIEILLVIALIAVAVSVVLVNFTAFADRGESTSPEEVLTAAIRKARFIAAAERITTKLSYDSENGSLRIDPGAEQFPINSDFGPDGRGEIRFFLIPSAQGLSPFPDPDRSTLETAAVAFAPDRSSSPFLAEIDSGRGSPARLRFDPFSSVIRTEE
ncbi:pilus assembly FimT family protein [Coraliomargarita sinensis]|nr:type II secretion system protein [Coraliomargarita sinensis]